MTASSRTCPKCFAYFSHFYIYQSDPTRTILPHPAILGKKGYIDKNLTAMTHVCQHRRKVLIAHSSLWTHLRCWNIERTRICIERSKSSPLEISLYEHGKSQYYRKEAFLLVIPHIDQIASISISGGKNLFQYFIKHFSCHVPLLRDLYPNPIFYPLLALDNTLFIDDLSSLRTLSLRGIVPRPIPWKDLLQLTAFSMLPYPPAEGMSVTQLLDLFSKAPRLSKIELAPIPTSPDTPAERVVRLPCLESLTLHMTWAHSSIFLNHLSLPAGVFLHVVFSSRGEKSPLPKLLPKNPENLQNLLHVTSAYLYFNGSHVSVRLDGPNGGLTMCGNREHQPKGAPVVSESDILRSLDYFTISRLQRLALTAYEFRWCTTRPTNTLPSIFFVSRVTSALSS